VVSEAARVTAVLSGLSRDDGVADRMSDRVARNLRRLIITLELRPGAPIIESQLMQRLDCGRTPLREALQRLADEYLVRAVPRRGMSVAEIGIFELHQTYEARQGIEGLLARLAAERATEQQLSVLSASTETMEQDGETADLFDTVERDVEFHSLIAEAGRNLYLRDAFRRVAGPTMRLMYFAHSHGQTIAQTYIEHRDVVDALRTQDPAHAERVMRSHIAQAKERILRTL
jgi:DNA-binding GntR family transcriptional regulator